MRVWPLTWLAGAAAYSGRTAPGRLNWVDDYLLARERDALFGQRGGVFADVGVGDSASTTVELAQKVAAAGAAGAPTVVGLEADAGRAAKARALCADVPGVAVRQTDGSFVVPLRDGETCVGARALNVFRSGYTPKAA
eukprot:CAMPEP_0119281638 /NCGR_PEP_ID=MMETSP1329-20130426/25138_1 /TAXON_ID=114041 /ORGANISM="Genus nov. species nov., Strain RCC1024" /LENGTH=137 /DNA_ID=CAMNT_0007282265 /DNA_START=126 /DNA_END=535 /DNA_ORIENTATION=-